MADRPSILTGLDLGRVATPCYVVDLAALERNLAVLETVRRRTGCKILLALKAFAMWNVFPRLRRVLDGTCASSPHEARLGREAFGGLVSVFGAAYSDADIAELVGLADHIIFNSFGQWRRFRAAVAVAPRAVECGLRINPEYSEVDNALYNPCAPFSRLGIVRANFAGESLDGIVGLHFHTLCEQGADALEHTLAAVERRFGDLIPGLKWVNFGGGHHITRPGYDVDRLCRLVGAFHERYGVEVILEPGEAVALNAGALVATVLDIVRNEMDIAILDTSAAAHMPDVLEMPYRPGVVGAGEPGAFPHTYRLAGLSCLAGDVIGDYAFPCPLRVGDRVAFLDMAHYTMVKNTTFNGVRLPSIALYEPETDTIDVVRTFGYCDYRDRLS